MGAERPVLVLLPGMDGTGRLFAPFVEALGGALETRVVRYPPRAALDYAALEPIARAAMPSDRPFVLLGEPSALVRARPHLHFFRSDVSVMDSRIASVSDVSAAHCHATNGLSVASVFRSSITSKL